MVPIVIKQINVRNLGPLQHFRADLAKLNLIYGHNERGKTYLVEFVIRALFKHAGNWKLRSHEAQGRVKVVGLPNRGAVDFSPMSPTKLEDFWEEAIPGLPPDFSKLLVVKGAEVQIANTDGGVDKAVLKRFLSNKSILDKIESRVSKTLREAKLENQVILGPKRGDIAAKGELEQQLKMLDRLFEQLNRGYSRGYYRTLLDKKQEIEQDVDQMLLAKRHLAFRHHADLQRLRRQLSHLTKTDVQDVRRQLILFKQKDFEFKRKQEKQQTAEQNSEHYLWLKQAHALYQDALTKASGKPNPHFLVAALLLLVAGAILIFLQQPYFAAGCLLGVLGFGLFYFKKYQDFHQTYGLHSEIARLEQQFRQRFKQDLTGLPQITELLEATEEEYTTARLLDKQLTEDISQLHALKLSVSDGILALVGERKDPKTWDEVLETVENQVARLQERIREKELQLARLGVDPSDYEAEFTGVEYSQHKLEALQTRLQAVEQDITDELQKLASLKQMICHQTGDDISTSWEDVIAHLRDKRQQCADHYKQRVAEIIGKITVMDVVRTLRRDEDSKIISGLNSKVVQAPVLELTKRYNKVQLKGDRLLVSDPFQDFYLSDLSSGAQEQVLLALRIGFSCKLMRQDAIFLILDDAFQYSDWERRPHLVEKVVALAQNGWQILYFTMDDNIRDLFLSKAKVLRDEFLMIELEGETVSAGQEHEAQSLA